MCHLIKYLLILGVWVFLEVFQICDGFLWHSIKNQTSRTSNVTTKAPVIILKTDRPREEHNKTDPIKAEAGTIAGLVFGVLVGLVILIVVGLLYIRKKRERNTEYQRQLHVMKTSSQSAGVYMDTTTDTNTYTPSPLGTTPKRKYTSLKKDRNLYEDDSEDELWSSEVR